MLGGACDGFLDLDWQFDGAKVLGRIKVVVAGFVDDSNLTVLLSIGVWNERIELADLQLRLIVIVLAADDEFAADD